MPWKEVSPGRFEKPLDKSEAFFWALNAAPKPPNRERWAISSVAEFKSDCPKDQIANSLRQVMKVMRYHHPAIAATLEEDKKVYIVPDDKELESWLDQIVVVEPVGADVDAVLGEYKSSPLTRLHYFPGTQEIMLHMPHWRSDGVGLSTFTEHVFSVLANPYDVTLGDEGKRLPPSLEEVAQVCEITPEKQAKIGQKWAKIFGAGRSLGLPFKPAIATGTYRRTQQLPEKLTSSIIAACKKRNISFTTAIAASLVGVVKQNHPDEGGNEPKKYITFPFVNLRQVLAKTMNPRDNPFTVMIVNDPMILDVEDFESNTKQIGPFYAQALNPESGMETLSLASAWLESSIKMMAPPAPPAQSATAKPQTTNQPAPPIISTPALNSLGVLDRQLKYIHEGKHRFEITDFRFGVEILGPNLLVYAWTFRSKMRLTIFYNEGFNSASYVQKILDQLIETLLHDLGLPKTEKAKL